jgi:hypothetical protein
VGTALASSSGEVSHFAKLARAGHSPTHPRDGAIAATLPSGQVLIAGGSGRLGSGSETSAELFNPATDTFSELTGRGRSLSEERSGAVAATLRSGKVLIAGRGKEGAPPSAELFNPASDTFTKLSGNGHSPTEVRPGAVAAVLPSGEVLIAGGDNFHRATGQYGSLRSAELFNPAKDTFTRLSGHGHSMVQPRDGASAATLPNGDVLIAGGLANSGAVASAELFDPATDTFTMLTGPEQSLTEGRSWAVAATLRSGQVLIAGGDPDTCNSACFRTGVSIAELFNPATDTFTRLTGPEQSLTEVRKGAVAALLPDGQVLIAGGHGLLADPRRDHTDSTAELFNPTTDTFRELRGSG